MSPTDRIELTHFLESGAFQRAQVSLRSLLKRHLINALGGNWEQIHNEYGMYTINCRVKSTRRTLDKCSRLAADGTDISLKNFFRKLPDLAAARLVVVDPDDMFRLAEEVRKGCLEPA